MASYNGERFIRRQIESILAQIGPGDELIVSDDSSTDATAAVVKGIGDARIKLLKGPCLKSPTANFENALRHARGGYVFLSDQDDVWKPGKVSTCMRWLERCDCVVSDAEMADARLEVTHESYYALHGTRPGRLYNTLVRNGYMGCCMAFTRRVLDAALPFPPGTPMHDIWIGNVAAYKYGVRFIPDRLVTYRCHGANSSFTAAGKSGYTLARKLGFRLTVVGQLLKKFLLK